MNHCGQPKLELRQICKSFNGPSGPLQVLRDISLSIPAGSLVSIIGPSGCGKSTLFNLIAGLVQADSGAMLFNGEPVANLRGKVGYMLQRDLLMPWRTVLNNIVVGLEVRGVARAEAVAKARDLLVTIGLSDFENAYPKHLSGGMRQRVALARTLITDPEVLLLDEPFSALDYQTRLYLENLLVDVAAKYKKTVVLVTHDVDEAIALSDKIFVLSARPGSMKSVHDIRISSRSPMDARKDQRFSEYFETLCEELDLQTAAPKTIAPSEDRWAEPARKVFT